MISFNSLVKYSLSFFLVFVLGMTTAQAESPQFESVITPNPLFVPYDAKTYPGIACEAQAVPEIDEFSNLAFDMVNANTGKRHVVCPIVRDNTTNVNGTYGVEVNVSNAANRNLECTLYSMDRFGVIIDSDTNSTANPGNQIIYLDVDASVEDGFYGINCDLAYTSAVRSYEVREFLETNDDSDGFAGF